MWDLIHEYIPALLVLVLAYYRDQRAEERNKRRLAELAIKIRENHDKVDADNADKSDADIVDDISKRSA